MRLGLEAVRALARRATNPNTCALLGAAAVGVTLLSGDPYVGAVAIAGVTALARACSRHASGLLLREASARRVLAEMVSGVVDYAIYRLSPEGVIETWNAGAARSKGYAEQEIIGRHFSVFYTAEDVAAGKPKRMLEMARTHSHSDEGWRVRKDGSRFWATVVVSPILDKSGNLLGYTKVTRDVTERVQAGERLAQAQKLEALGQLTGGVAHDFNNLLTVILGSIELAEVGAGGNARLLRHLAHMRTACIRGASLTHQLLAFSRRHPQQPVVLDVRKALDELVQMLSKTIRQDITIRCDFADSLGRVRVDPSQLMTALLNVTVNARDAMPNGGEIAIRAMNCELSGVADLHGRFVCIEISDNGCGIPERLMSQVLEPFFTTKEVGKGSGLGLSQAYGFCQQSGGVLTLDSQLGQGTKVTLHLPETEAQLAPVYPSGVRLPASEQPARVLVVEDDEAVAEIASGILEQSGFSVTSARTGREALEILARSEPFDLVFSDVVMPGGMLGVELARHIEADYPGTAVLLTSGYTETPGDSRGFDRPLLPKPYHAKELVDRVNAELRPSRIVV